MGDEIEQFVAGLAIPEDRKVVVLAELRDHAASAEEAARREGRDPEAAARMALGDLEALRRSLEAVEAGFRVTRRHAFVRALCASVIVAVLLDQGGPLMHGVLGVVLAVAIGALCAPPRMLELLRAELRAPRVRGLVTRGVPIGAAVTYLYTIMSVPYVIWIGLIVQRAIEGNTEVDAPMSTLGLLVVGYGVLLVEGVRVRRRAVA